MKMGGGMEERGGERRRGERRRGRGGEGKGEKGGECGGKMTHCSEVRFIISTFLFYLHPSPLTPFFRTLFYYALQFYFITHLYCFKSTSILKASYSSSYHGLLC